MAGEQSKQVEYDMVPYPQRRISYILINQVTPWWGCLSSYHLTQKGKALGKEATRVLMDANAEFLQVLTEKQRQELRSLISTLRLWAPRP